MAETMMVATLIGIVYMAIRYLFKKLAKKIT